MPEGVTTDLAGDPVSGATYTWRYRPASPSFTTVSNVANGVSGGALAIALAAPVVMSTAATGKLPAPLLFQASFPLYMLSMCLSSTDWCQLVVANVC